MNTIVEHINSAGFSFTEFAVPMLVQSCVLIVILLLLDLLLRKKVKAVFRYWIWMLVLLKLVLPTSLSSPLSLGHLFGDKLTYQELAETASVLEPAEPAPAETLPDINPLYIHPNPYVQPKVPVTSVVEPAIAEPVSPPAEPVTPLSWQGVVFLVWLAVVIAMGLLLLQRALFVRGLVAQAKEAPRLMNDELAYCCASMKIKSKVDLKISVNATTPSVCGLIRPVILVPWNLTSTLGVSRMRTVLMHELAHIRRADLWVNLAQTVLQIIYFYNPLLWLANCVIRRIREQAVDEAVLVAMGGKAQQYPQTLVDVAKMAFKRPALSLRLIGVVESKSALAGRIKHILSRPMPKSARLGLISILAIIIAGAILLPMAKARNEDKFSDKDLLIKFAELPEGATKKVSVDDTTIWSKSYEVEFAPGQDLLVAVEMYQAGQPVRIIGRNIFEGSDGPEKFTVTFDRTYRDAAKRSVTHNIQFKLGDQVFKIPVHTPRYLSTQWWDWYRGEGLQRPEVRHTKARYAGIETLFYYGAADSPEESEEDEAEFWIPGRWVTPIMSNYCVALKMIPLGSLKYLSVEPIGGYQGLDGKIISRSLTLEKADRIADEYKQMIIDSVGKQSTAEKQADMETDVQVEVEKTPQTVFTATLSNGVTVELVGICEHPSEGKQWWRPDGQPLGEFPYKVSATYTKSPNNKILNFLTAISPKGPAYSATKLEVSQGNPRGYWVCLESNSKVVKNWRAGGFEVPPTLEKADVKVGIAGGPWQKIAKVSPQFKGPLAEKTNLGQIQWLKSVKENGSGDLIVYVANNFANKADSRLIAVDNTGKEHFPYSANGEGNPDVTTDECRFQLRPNEVRELFFVVRPYQWVSFKNVSLQPGHKTDVQVEGEEAAEVSAESEVVTVPIVHDVQNKATLPNGVTVELIGLCEEPVGGAKWWKPDGSYMPEPFFKANKRTPPLKGMTTQYTFLAKAEGSEDISIKMKIYEGFGWSTQVAEDGTALCYIKHRNDAKPYYEDAFSQGPIEVGVAQGQWIKGRGVSSPNIQIPRSYSIGNHDEIVIQPPQPEKNSPETATIFWFTSSSHDYEYRLICTLKDGSVEECMKPFFQSANIIETGNLKNSTLNTKSFNIDRPLEQIVNYELLYRKFDYARFNNVVFKPNAKTVVPVGIKSDSTVQAVPLKAFEFKLVEKLLDLVKQVEKQYPQQATHWPAGAGLYHIDAQGRVTVWHYRSLWQRSTDCAPDEVGWGSSRLVNAVGMYYLPDGTPLQSRWRERGGGMKDIRIQVGREVGENERIPVIHRHRLPNGHDLLSRDGLERKILLDSWKDLPLAIIVRVDRPMRLDGWWLGDVKTDIQHFSEYDQLIVKGPPGNNNKPMLVTVGLQETDVPVEGARAKKTASQQLSFGPVTERVLSFNFLKDSAHLDLDTGRYGKEQPGKDLVAAAGESDGDVRAGLDMVAIPVEARRWESSPQEVLDEVAKGKRQRQARLGGPESRRTFFFKTREDSVGVLQILPLQDSSGQVKVRYKLVKMQTSKKTDVPVKSESVDTDNPRAAISAIVEQLKSVKHVHSGRGSADVVEVWSSSSYQSSTRTEKILDFRFEGDLSRSDAFTSEKGKRGDFECSWAVGPLSSVRYNSSYGSATVQARPFSRFHRKLGYDFHPETFPRMHQSSTVELLEGMARQPQVNLKVTQESKDVMRVVSEYKSETSEQKLVILLINGVDGIRLSSWEFTAKDSKEDDTGARRSSLRLKWKKYAGVWYISEAISEGAGVHDGLRSEGRTTVTIREFTPNVEIEDKEFTLDGLDIPPGTKVNDWILDTRYKYAGSKGESADNLRKLSRAAQMYANDYDNKFPDTMQQLKQFLEEKELKWLSENVCYLGKGKTVLDLPEIPLAYDKTMLEAEQSKGTNVLFVSGIVSFREREQLKKLGITAGTKADVPVEVEGTAEAEIERLRETRARRAIAERRKGRIVFFGLDLTDTPRTTKWADLSDLFEARPPGSKSYHIREDVTAVYNGFDGTVYYIPEKEIFYIQHDKLGSSTLTYYGPFNGDPHKVLGKEKDVPVDVKGTEAVSGESDIAADQNGPRITFESLVCDLGQIPPNTKRVCEFKYTNTGNALLKITRVGAACACTVPQKTRECAPGESETLKVTYRASGRAGRITKPVYVYSNDKVNPKVTLTIKAEIVIKVAHEPERLNILLKGENAGCTPITLTSLDNQPFSITGFKSTGDSITADFDPSVKGKSFVLKPKVDMEKLGKGMKGQIEISLTHPECKKLAITYDTLAEFKFDPRVVYVRDAEPRKVVTKKVFIFSNYNEDVEVESTSSKKGTVKVLAQQKVRNGHQFELKITPPARESNKRVFTDVFTVVLKGGQKLQMTCYGIYSKKPAKTAVESAPQTDKQSDVEEAGEKVSQFIGVDLPTSVQYIKFHSGSFGVADKTWIRFDIPLSDLKNLLAKSDRLPDFSDLHNNPKIQKDMDEVYKVFSIEWWKSDELESPISSSWIKNSRIKGAPKDWVVNILNICCSQLKNNLMRVYISLYLHAHDFPFINPDMEREIEDPEVWSQELAGDVFTALRANDNSRLKALIADQGLLSELRKYRGDYDFSGLKKMVHFQKADRCYVIVSPIRHEVLVDSIREIQISFQLEQDTWKAHSIETTGIGAMDDLLKEEGFNVFSELEITRDFQAASTSESANNSTVPAGDLSGLITQPAAV